MMSYAGADWLVRETREQEEQPEAMLDAIRIARGATVADIGAGVGYMTWRLARRVGPTGRCTRSTSSPRCSGCSGQRPRAGATNIKPMLAAGRDPKLPEGRSTWC